MADLVPKAASADRRVDRRRAPRYPCNAELEMEWGSAVLRGRVRNISMSGMFIESADPLWVGAGFRARLVLEEPVHVNCFVRRVEPGSGMGVSVALADEEHQRFRKIVQCLARTAS